MIISSLITLFCTISLASTSSNITADKEDYLKQLVHQYQNIQRLIADVETINSNLNTNVALFANASTQTKLRISAVQDIQKLNLQMWDNTFLPYSLKTWNCPSVPASNYSIFTKNITQIGAAAESSLQTLKSQPYCYRNQQMKNQYQYVLSSTNGLRKEIISNCSNAEHLKIGIPFLDTQNSRQYPNLQTNVPWTYGNINASDFNSKVQQFTSLYGATSCPLNLPFLSIDNTCITCSKEGQIYDVSLKACRNCDSNCIINGGKFNSNPIALNANGSIPQQIVGVPYCSRSQPFFDGLHCISCNYPLFFNFALKKCEVCPNDSVFDQKTKLCKSNIFFVNFNGKDLNMIGQASSPPPYSSLKTCPQDKPFTNGVICIACVLPQFFNMENGQCQSCPNGLLFNLTTRSCGGGTGTKFNSYLLGQRNFVGKVPIYQSLLGVCSKDKRYFNGVECIVCEIPKFFNFFTLSCETCPLKYTFDTTIQACQSDQQHFFTNIQSSNIYFNGNFGDIVSKLQIKKANGLKQCDINIPFFDSKTNQCISCPSNFPLFDIRKGLCISCPSNSSYDSNARICISKQISATIERMMMNSR